jgi:hypothetical protein
MPYECAWCTWDNMRKLLLFATLLIGLAWTPGASAQQQQAPQNGINPCSQFGIAYYSAIGASNTALNCAPAPIAPNGVPQFLISTPVAGVATSPVLALAGVPINPQTGTTYTIAATDRASYLSINNAAAIAVTLPQAGTAGFGFNFVFNVCDIGAGTATITPTTSTISYSTGGAYTSAATSLVLSTGQCAFIYSDNTNYFAIVRTGVSSGVSSFTGDGNFATNSGSSGAVTLTLHTVPAHNYWGNNTGSTGAGGYFQPAFTDLSGSAACSQMPALTGDVTSTAGTCATTVTLIKNVPFGLSLGSGSGTAGQLACATVTNTMGNCTGTPSNNYLGVFLPGGTTYATAGIISVVIDATQNVTFGDILCASSIAGKAHDNGTVSCAAGEGIGVVTTSATSVSTVTASLRIQ